MFKAINAHKAAVTFPNLGSLSRLINLRFYKYYIRWNI